MIIAINRTLILIKIYKKIKTAFNRFSYIVRNFLFNDQLTNLDQLRAYSYYNQNCLSEQTNYNYLNFTLSFIALAAKLIKIDSPSNEQESMALIKIFGSVNVPNKINKLLTIALNDYKVEYEYASKIIDCFGKNKNLYQQMFNHLITIALADGPMNNNEFEWLLITAQIFGIKKIEIVSLLKRQIEKSNLFISSILTINNINQLNKLYRKVIINYHPDNLLCYSNLAIEYLQLITEQFNLINKTYYQLKKKLR